MKLSFYIARRYVFSKKTHNVINIISGISVFGIAISTMAMVVVLSGFNGIEHVIEEMYTAFDSDIRITPSRGKTFFVDEIPREKIAKIDGVEASSLFIEETTILKSAEQNWVLSKMKGVEDTYIEMNGIDNFIKDGVPVIEREGYPYAIAGAGLLRRLDTYVSSRSVKYIHVGGLLGDEKLSKQKDDALNEMQLGLSASFEVNPKYDDSHFLVPLWYAQEVLGYDNEVSGIELSISDNVDASDLKSELEGVLGSSFKVQDKDDQNALLFNTHKSEKWMTFLILCFIFLLATFNMIASLTMLVLDKRKDMSTLRAMGADKLTIRKIFIYEGLLINFLGALLGIGIGLAITLGQAHFGWVSMGGNSFVEAFPVKIVWIDLLWIFGTVLAVGIVTTYIPVRLLLRKSLN